METARERIVEPANSKQTNGPTEGFEDVKLGVELAISLFLFTECFDVLFCTVISMYSGTSAHSTCRFGSRAQTRSRAA